MKTQASIVYASTLVLLWCLSGFAQTPALVPTEDAGVARAALMDRPEVRIIRVEIQPGAVRRMHTHEDVRFHLFIPLTSGIEFTVGSKEPAKLAVQQAYFLEKGTPHGFRNTGTGIASALEVFVKSGPASAERYEFGIEQAKSLAYANVVPKRAIHTQSNN